MFVPTFFIFYFFSYWGIAACFIFCDYFNLFTKYKVNKSSFAENLPIYKKCSLIVLRNQFAVQLPNLYFLEYIIRDVRIPVYLNVLYLVINVIYNIFSFTFCHYTIHQFKELYYFHKKHHEIKNTLCLASEYNSIIEEIINWTISTWLLCFFFKMDYQVNILYIVFNTIYGTVGHSGYMVPYFDKEIYRHYLHHKYFNVNYSGVEMLDIWLGTNRVSETKEERE